MVGGRFLPQYTRLHLALTPSVRGLLSALQNEAASGKAVQHDGQVVPALVYARDVNSNHNVRLCFIHYML